MTVRVRLGLAVVLAVLLPASGHAETTSMSADLALGFECKSPPSEAAIEAFLKAKNFHVANDERMRRQLGAGFFPLEIEAYDARRWSIRFIGLIPSGPQTIHYDATIDSPPPTHHDAQLERDLEAFIETTLQCRVNQRSVRENGPEAAAFYDTIFSMLLSRTHEVDVCDRTTATYGATACGAVPGVK